MPLVVDQIGRKLEVEKTPQKVISLVPSLTELMLDLGVELIGRTKFCVHPAEQVNLIPTYGGTKNPKVADIKASEADLVIANKEENNADDVDELSKDKTVFTTDISNMEDTLDFVQQISGILEVQEKGQEISQKLRYWVETQKTNGSDTKILYMIWREPWMAAASGTYIDDMIQKMGWQNVLADKTRYPKIDTQELQHLDPDFVLLSSEPYPFEKKHIAEIQEIFPDAKILLVDGEAFSWYGSRLLKKTSYLKDLKKTISEQSYT